MAVDVRADRRARALRGERREVHRRRMRRGEQLVRRLHRPDAEEAFIKALGDGLRRPLNAFTVTVDRSAALLDAPGWTLRDVPVPPGYSPALAVEGGAASVRVPPWSPSQGVSRGHQPRTARR